MHKHHIVFRSHGGMDTDYNIKIFRGYEDHEGNGSPHACRETDLKLKRDLQKEYYDLFGDKEEYTLEEIAKKLRKSENYIFKRMRKVKNWAGNYKRDDIIKHLMGGKFF